MLRPVAMQPPATRQQVEHLNPELIRNRILTALPDARVDVRDTTGGGDHFAASVVTDAFRGLGAVDRHRAVYAALGELMRGPIHALALETKTLEEDRP